MIGRKSYRCKGYATLLNGENEQSVEVILNSTLKNLFRKFSNKIQNRKYRWGSICLKEDLLI